MKPITLYSHQYGPNPWKVALILEELGVDYMTIFVPFTEAKQTPYTMLNPNGRLPSITDPNTGLTLWESGAIVEYLIDHYDKGHKISYAPADPPAEQYYHQARQWLFFQASGQAPYYGQAAWFARMHPEKIPSAIERYRNEIYRVTSVLDNVLAGRKWLVGDKCTYADLSFVSWQRWAVTYGGDDLYERYPQAGEWMSRLEKRETVKKVYADQDRAIAKLEGK
ncbi:hypothetical protein N7517_010870 [Penicillium concentricum]|uniref:glutathione transferase n=1 Tax=Penicillium concentricum TaxID=293559 RepID=A0A9W9UVH6_9EURO|nr:uncharacterized protein N7517_010870 [Penicillium concentricum]KAJ5356261.1 hypothetical protein N7517_010870 [Penicillium concentricum]